MTSSKLELIYGPEAAHRITSANILVVGAGGIGCELMKTLSVTGFKNITIIDLDTIDVSNLNRQFLFRKEHVDKSKAEVVRDQIMLQNPGIKVTAYVGRIQEERFGFRFFSTFDLVINALDNEEARKHVNQQCFNLDIPLVDSGTNGYAAQCIPICKGKTPCYQCVDRPKDQSFPVCTIRQKPEKLIHCIVWAKALFEGLFGPKENASNIIQDIVNEIKECQSTDRILFAEKVFDRVFNHEVRELQNNLNARLQQIEIPVDDEQATQQEELESDKQFVDKIKPLEFAVFKEDLMGWLTDSINPLNRSEMKDELSLKVWSLQDQLHSFVRSIVKLYEERADQIGSLIFNKDDDLIIDFVSAATNIRASNFSIPMESMFKIKEMAGKIIPAISSSNALVAALQVQETIKILTGNFKQMQGIVYQRLDPVRLQSFTRVHDDPNPDCPVCTDDSKYIFSVEVKDLGVSTLQDFITKVFDETLHLKAGYALEFLDSILYESSQDLDEDEAEMYERRVKKTLSALKVKDLSKFLVQGTFLDSSTDSQIYIEINQTSSLTENIKVTLLKQGLAKKLTEHTTKQPATSCKAGKQDQDGNVCLSEDEEEIEIAPAKNGDIGKRTEREEEIETVGDTNKRVRVQ